MRLLKTFTTGKIITSIKYHAGSDSLFFGALDAAEIASLPLTESAAPLAPIALPAENEGVFDFDIDPAGEVVAVSLDNNEAALVSLSKRKWTFLKVFNVFDNEYSGAFARVYFLPYANQVCFAAMNEMVVTFRVDVKRKKLIDWIPGINQSCSVHNGGEMLCFHSNFDSRGLHRFYFAQDEKKRSQGTHQSPLVSSVFTQAHFIPDGRRLLLLNEGVSAELWDLENLRVFGTLEHALPASTIEPTAAESTWREKIESRYEYVEDTTIPCSILSPNGRWAYLPVHGTLLRISVDPLAVESQAPMPHQSFVTARCLIPTKNQVATSSADGTIALWEFDADDLADTPQPASVAERLRKTIRSHSRFPDPDGISFAHFHEDLAEAKKARPKKVKPIASPPVEASPAPSPPKNVADCLKEAGPISPTLALLKLYWHGHDMNALSSSYSPQPAIEEAVRTIFAEPKLQNTWISEEAEDKRRFAAVDWAIHTMARRWLEHLGSQFRDTINALERVPPITSWPTLAEAVPPLKKAALTLGPAFTEWRKTLDPTQYMELSQSFRCASRRPYELVPDGPFQGLSYHIQENLTRIRLGLPNPDKHMTIFNAVTSALQDTDPPLDAAEEAGLKAAQKFARGIDPDTIARCTREMVRSRTFDKVRNTLVANILYQSFEVSLFDKITPLAKVEPDWIAAWDDNQSVAEEMILRDIQALLEQIKPLEDDFFNCLSGT